MEESLGAEVIWFTNVILAVKRTGLFNLKKDKVSRPGENSSETIRIYFSCAPF